ncbi:MAG: hypothetical protein KJ922_02980, partial [Nanoarchaeota archaeon]|nr:hypothetical protein [Nanoarchaeota archaeon]
GYGVTGQKDKAKAALGESYIWDLPVGAVKTVGGIAQRTVTLGQTDAKWADGGLAQATTILTDAVSPVNHTLQGVVDGAQTVTTAPLAAALTTSTKEADNAVKSTSGSYAINGSLGAISAAAAWFNDTVNSAETAVGHLDAKSKGTTVDFSGIGNFAKSLVIDTPIAIVQDAEKPVSGAVSIPTDKAGDLALAAANIAHFKGKDITEDIPSTTASWTDKHLNLSPQVIPYTWTDADGQVHQGTIPKPMWDYSVKPDDSGLERTVKTGGHVLGVTNPHWPLQYNDGLVPLWNQATDIAETPAGLVEAAGRITKETHNPVAGVFGGIGTGLKNLSRATSAGVETIVDVAEFEQRHVGDIWVQHDTVTHLDENTGKGGKDWSHKASNFIIENVPPAGAAVDHWTPQGRGHDGSWRSLLNIDLLVPGALGILEYQWFMDHVRESDSGAGKLVERVVPGGDGGEEGGNLIH